jgi:hypothetical protein
MVLAGCGFGCLAILSVRTPRIIRRRLTVRRIITVTITTMAAVRIMADLMAAGITAVDLTEAVVAGIINFDMSRLPNNSPEPTPIAFTVPLSRLTGWAARLSFCR